MPRLLPAALFLASAAAAPAADRPDAHALARQLESARVAERIQAAKALNDLSPNVKDVLPQLAKALRDEYLDVRMNAAHALRKAGAAAVPVLVQALRDEHFWPRYNAARILSQIGPAAKAATPQLGQALADKAIDVRHAAAEALANLDDTTSVAVQLAGALADSNARVRSAAVEALSHSGTAALPQVIRLLRHHDPGVRQSAAKVIGLLGPAAAEALPSLVESLQAEVRDAHRQYDGIDNEGIRQSRIRGALRASQAVLALSQMGRPAVELLLKRMDGTDALMTCYVMEVLGRLRRDASAAVPAVLKVLQADTAAWQRARAAGVLGSIAPGDERVIAALGKALDDKDEGARRHSAYALGRLGPKGIAVLIDALQAASNDRKIAAIHGLRSAGAAAKAAAGALKAAAKDKDEAVSKAAAAALQAIEGP